VAYQKSPHARVKCVDCHIGAGAGWYVRSKLSGARQVVSTLLNNYERPIPVPVHDLRPARETCEECHWPGKSFGNIEHDRHYYSTGADGKPSAWALRMLMHVSVKEKDSLGIHAHMSVNNKVSYVPGDEKRQVITWVKSVNENGEATIYTTKNSPYKNAAPPAGKVRQMDCMDCHTRPSHHYEAPMPLVNRAMTEGKIDPSIPHIKDKAVAVLAKKYATEDEAVAAIRSSLLSYYKEKQAAYYAANEKVISNSIEAVIDLFKNNMFPEMKVRWDVYPDNIGHMISPGCFRCHDGEHLAPSGKAITRDCNTCHAIIAQGPADNVEKSVDGLPFRHPFDGDESWKEMNCADCHSGS
ncbi:MAG: cytochrome C, partial [Candidatus Omnitrophota bacterium]